VVLGAGLDGVRYMSPPSAFEPQTLQLVVASRYTDYAIRAALLCGIF